MIKSCCAIIQSLDFGTSEYQKAASVSLCCLIVVVVLNLHPMMRPRGNNCVEQLRQKRGTNEQTRIKKRATAEKGLQQ